MSGAAYQHNLHGTLGSTEVNAETFTPHLSKETSRVPSHLGCGAESRPQPEKWLVSRYGWRLVWYAISGPIRSIPPDPAIPCQSVRSSLASQFQWLRRDWYSGPSQHAKMTVLPRPWAGGTPGTPRQTSRAPPRAAPASPGQDPEDLQMVMGTSMGFDQVNGLSDL